MSRTFKLQIGDSDEYTGRYTGNSPYQAANKAFSEYLRSKKRKRQSTTGSFKFTLVESTQNSNHKMYRYQGKRVKLPKPVVYSVGDNEIVKEYKNKIQKVKK
jgi:hypothetical protein